MPQPERYYFTDFHTIGLKKKTQVEGPMFKGSVNTVKLQNKPWGLYFSKALFEGLIFGGAYIRRGLYTEGNLHFKIS